MPGTGQVSPPLPSPTSTRLTAKLFAFDMYLANFLIQKVSSKFQFCIDASILMIRGIKPGLFFRLTAELLPFLKMRRSLLALMDPRKK